LQLRVSGHWVIVVEFEAVVVRVVVVRGFVVDVVLTADPAAGVFLSALLPELVT
jgi:hypothetical protein